MLNKKPLLKKRLYPQMLFGMSILSVGAADLINRKLENIIQLLITLKNFFS
ncbi:hypothetical protein JXB31_03105 [Candidatus Woesearchaeota archaeon]|nr:hypothetical protein [Candidatus Woesearchaeota archaeon]